VTTPRPAAHSAAARTTAYLDDLARMLADLDPGTRDEVLAGVREHLDATLAEHPDDPGAVDAAILRLGPPERVAAEARADAPATPLGPGTAGSTAPRPLHPTRTRVAAAVALALVVLPALWVLVGRLALLTVLNSDPGSGAEALMPHPGEILLMGPLSPVWLVAIVLVLVAPQVSARSKLRLALCGPAVVVLALVGTFWLDPMALSTTVLLAGLLAVVVVAVRTTRAVWRETRT
jgi:hypothetical protein